MQRRRRCEGHRRGRWAWLRCPWAATGPGRAIHSDLAPLVRRAPEGPVGQAAVPVGGDGAWQSYSQRPTPTGAKGTGGTGGPGRGAGGRRRGPAELFTATYPHWCEGHRRDRRARLRCPWAATGPGRASRRRAERSSRRGQLAGGPPPTGTTSSPARQHTTRQPVRAAARPRN